jgi:cytochrome c551/c552
MVRTVAGLALLAAATAGAQSVPHQQAGPALVQRYCAGCHNDKLRSGGLTFSKLDAAHPETDPKTWEKVIVKLRAGMMPPARAPRPERAALNGFVESLETALDRAAIAHPNPGRPSLHRLNRTEYANSVHDLLGLDVDVASLLPPDDMSHGFDNMAEVLNVSPTLMEAYVRAAGRNSRLAVGDAKMRPLVETYHIPSTFSQTRHVEGTPFGTRGGAVFRHNFPADGEYTFRLTLYFTTNTFVFGTTAKDQQVEVAVNGERVALMNVNPRIKVDEDLRTPPIKVKAGPRTVTASFIEAASGPADDFLMPYEQSLGDLFAGQIQGLTTLPHLRDLGIDGPYHATGVSDTPSRDRIFACRPTGESEEIPCARRILSALARRAYRRPATAADLEDLLSVFQEARNQGDFESGIRVALQAILADPQFVFRFEGMPPSAAPGKNYRVSNLELASRLSYFLWSTAPDDELLNLASRNRLADPLVLERQVRRMLADPRSAALARNFAGQWLYLRNLSGAQPDVFTYPNFDNNLLQSMQRETELFFDSIVRENRNVVDLLTADYTFVDERLARHYGIPNVEGNRFRRVAVTDDNRRGLLGQASILTVTSFANRTSPVVRGKWILDNLLGAPPPSPPANVPPLKESAANTKTVPVRVRLEEHRSNPACASCHQIMDPIGFALENFDATGAWRIHDGTGDVDASGQLVDGVKVDGPASLRRALVNHSDAFIRVFSAKLLAYALGRGLEPYDMPAVRAIDRGAALRGNRFSEYVLGIVRSLPFQMRRAEEMPATEVAEQVAVTIRK